MNPIGYLKKNGLGRAFQVLWQYKLDRLLCRAVGVFQGKKPLVDAIVLESHNDFDCNGGAFYRYLLEKGLNRKWKIIWLLKNKAPAQLPDNVRCYRLHGPSLGKAYYLSRARLLCFDNEVITKPRPDQTLVFCDHGAVGLKSVRDLYGLPEGIDFFLAPSKNYIPVLEREYRQEGRGDRFAPIGYPSHDVLFLDIPPELDKLTDKTYQKVFLWMPTFRVGGGFRRKDSQVEQPFGVPLIQTQEDLDALQSFLQEHNCLLILKIHPMQSPETLVRLHGSENIRVLTGQTVKQLGVDNYRLLKSADALISDYSTIAFSYLLLDRPLAFVLSDLEEYKPSFQMENPEDFLVGEQIRSFPDFYRFLESTLRGEDPWKEKRGALAEWLYDDRDGQSCARLAALLKME